MSGKGDGVIPMKRSDLFFHQQLDQAFMAILNISWFKVSNGNGHGAQAIAAALKPLKHQGHIVCSYADIVPSINSKNVGIIVVQPRVEPKCWWWRFDIQDAGVVRVFGTANWDLRDVTVREILKRGQFPDEV